MLASAQTPVGVPARPNVDQYAAHAFSAGSSYGATLLTSDQVKHLFAFDISKEYLVFEIGCYPAKGAWFKVDPAEFVLDTGKPKDREPVRPSDALTVAAAIQHANTPRLDRENGPHVYGGAEVGYESATDPVTGRRIHGTYTAADVGVGNEPGPPVPPYPTPGSLPEDRRLLQQQLAERGLPAGSFDHPVAGYLYFPKVLVKSKKDLYVLHLSDATVLNVPTKAR